MNFFFSKIKYNILAALAIILGINKRIDYKLLNDYILNINQMTDIENIFFETSKCLKKVLSYKLFAFAIQNDDQLNAWIDPDIYSGSFGKVIRSDFNLNKNFKINYMNKSDEIIQKNFEFRFDNLFSFELKNEKYSGRIYLISQNGTLSHKKEIMNVILKTVAIAVTNFLNIKKLKKAAAVDSLTGCYNRREFSRLINRHISSAERYKKDLSILMFDIDYFKKVNDTYGHQAGDFVLKKISSTILKEIRSGDLLARYGGEEFIMILPETKKVKAIEMAERLRKIIENLIINIEGIGIKVTASFGISTLNSNFDSKSFIHDADSMLLKAKTNGRNMVMPGVMQLCTEQQYN